MFLVMIKGTYDVGGIDFVWEKATESGRIELPEYDLVSISLFGFNKWMIFRYLFFPLDLSSI